MNKVAKLPFVLGLGSKTESWKLDIMRTGKLSSRILFDDPFSCCWKTGILLSKQSVYFDIKLSRRFRY